MTQNSNEPSRWHTVILVRAPQRVLEIIRVHIEQDFDPRHWEAVEVAGSAQGSRQHTAVTRSSCSAMDPHSDGWKTNGVVLPCGCEYGRGMVSATKMITWPHPCEPLLKHGEIRCFRCWKHSRSSVCVASASPEPIARTK